MKNDQRQMARNLYFETEFTQGQIADLVGISQKTMSFWASEEHWKRLKILAQTTPDIVAENMYQEVCRLNDAIVAREPGNPHCRYSPSRC